jgi:hypothetical protein
MIEMMKTGAKLEAIASNAMNMERTKTKLQMIRSYKESFGYLRIYLASMTLLIMVKRSMKNASKVKSRTCEQVESMQSYLKL